MRESVFDLVCEPCPFCGCEDVAFYTEEPREGEFHCHATCSGCHTHVKDVGFGGTADRALLDGKCHWNVRALPTSLVKRTEFGPVCGECGSVIAYEPSWAYCPMCGCVLYGWED